MARVVAWRVQLSAWVLVAACAPSVPHAPEPQSGPDAGVDHPSTILEAAGGAAGGLPRDAAIRDSAAASADAPVRDGSGESSAAADAHADAKADVAYSDAAHADAHTDTDGAVWPTDAQVARPPGPGDLEITELLINPAGTDTNREWIEVVNLAPDAVDLHLLTVADAASEIAVDAGVLAPHTILVLGQSLDATRNGGAPVGFSFGNVISLNNGGDTIRLCLGPCAGGVVIAEVSWPADLGAAFDGHAAVIGTHAGQPDGQTDGDGDGDRGGTIVFCPADQPFGSAGSFGRPGLPDPPCPG
ncbi:MAG TPA: lamin tail domain-containing protein [Polyangia bacterium]|jgi:hypothetical protein|nr:lamin tail domain-containing protein [Polyangia bacterium]